MQDEHETLNMLYPHDFDVLNKLKVYSPYVKDYIFEKGYTYLSKEGMTQYFTGF